MITTSFGTTPFVNTLITPTAVSSPTWSNPTKLQSQTTFSGKENENVEDWLSLLEVILKLALFQQTNGFELQELILEKVHLNYTL